jgi:hypothetical protein
MGNLLISALATACILSAVEAFLLPLGKWRGLLGLAFSAGFCMLLDVGLRYLTPYILGSTFVGLILSLLVEQIFTGVEKGNLPKRIPPR